MPSLFIKPNLAHDITFSVVTPDDVAYTQGAARRGSFTYWGYLDYDRARVELSLAQNSLPNEPLLFQLAGFIDRRQGRWVNRLKILSTLASSTRKTLLLLVFPTTG
jgi:hypothetical protein